jgi:hypothetical protein
VVSEWAITTAAREAAARIENDAHEQSGSWNEKENTCDCSWDSGMHITYNCPLHDEDAVARAVVDAVRPLVVREEHDRLRTMIEALPRIASMTATDYSIKVRQIDTVALEDVLALLGESTQEQASE